MIWARGRATATPRSTSTPSRAGLSRPSVRSIALAHVEVIVCSHFCHWRHHYRRWRRCLHPALAMLSSRRKILFRWDLHGRPPGHRPRALLHQSGGGLTSSKNLRLVAAFILPYAVVQERHVFDAECCCALRLPQSGSTMSQTRQLHRGSTEGASLRIVRERL